METTQTINNSNTVPVSTVTTNPYLVTTAVDPESLEKDQMNSDLAQLSKAEEKSNYKANIAKGVKNPQMYRAMSALRLTNPFKGV
jgi:fructosamine-3-kinase